MISALQSSTNTKDTGRSYPIHKPLEVDLTTCYLVHPPDPFTHTVRCSSTTASAIGTSVDHLSSLLLCSHLTGYFGRAATMNRHDTDAWAQERGVYDTELDAVVASSSLRSNDTATGDLVPTNAVKCLMELQIERSWTLEQSRDASQLPEDTIVHPQDRFSLVAPDSGVSPNVIVGSCSREDLSVGRHRVSEILVHYGVMNASGMSPTEPIIVGCCSSSGFRPADAPAMSGVTAELPICKDDGALITALADWTFEWVHALVIQPYLGGNFRFHFQGMPSRASTLVAPRIRRVFASVGNPVQVAVHALWFIGTLTGNSAYDNLSFLSVPIFRYLHNNGTFVGEDFMFRIFVTCAMIGDKTVNDTSLSTNTWNFLTRIPQAILNATEKYALSCLEWNVVMTHIQWQDIIIYLRSCIKMGSAFDPFSYDRTSSSGLMARYLDELINLSYVDETCTSQQGAAEIFAPQLTRHFMRRKVFDASSGAPKMIL